MPSDSVSVDKAQFGIDYELCWGAAVGLPDIVLVSFEPESVRFRFVGLGSELTMNLSEAQPVGSPDIVLVIVQPESVRFRILVLLNLLGVTQIA